MFRIVEERSGRPVEIPTERALRERVVVGLTNETLLLARDGRRLPIADSAAPIRGKNDRLYGAVLVFRDVTDHRATEAALREAKEVAEVADRAKGEFLATMSHELRSPLHVIMGYGAMLCEDAFGVLRAEQRDAVQRMNGSARQLYDLITTLLDLSRIEAGRLPVHTSEVRIAELLAQVRDEMREQQDASGLEFVWHAEPESTQVRTDQEKLRIIVRNLVGNAIKFTREGYVAVTARPARGGVEIRCWTPAPGFRPMRCR